MHKAAGWCYGSGVKQLVLAIVLAWTGLAAAQSQPQQRQREVLRERPSGFWTSNRPAEGGAYKWRLLGIGVVLAGVTGIVLLRVMRAARESREARIREGRQP